jgi:hypothetical protein
MKSPGIVKRPLVKTSWTAFLLLALAGPLAMFASASRADGVSGGVGGGPAVGSVIDGVLSQNPSLNVGDTFTLRDPFLREHTCIGPALAYRVNWSYLYISTNSGLASSGVNYTVRVEEVGPLGSCSVTPAGNSTPSKTVRLKIISIN